MRRRLFVVLGAVVVGAGVGLAYSPHVIRWLKAPAGDLLPHLAFLNPAEGFMAHVKVATTIGITLAMPVVLYEIWAFIRPGLSPRERRYGLWFIVWGSALFIIGIIVAYGALLPTALRFLLSFGDETLVPVISISQYVGFTTTMLLVSGAVFQLPIAVFLLARIGVVTPQLLVAKWRIAVLGMTILASVLTPTTDLVNMVLFLALLLVLYEVSIILAWLAHRQRRPR